MTIDGIFEIMVEPWKTLIETCIDKMHGTSVDNLELPTDIALNRFEASLLDQVLALVGKSDPSIIDFKAML
jgi:hypothetical protein